MKTYQTTVRVIYGDTDNMGIAYHANYFRWFEIGRSEMFRSLGLAYREIEKRGIFLPVSEVGCKFLAPIRYDDLLVIATTLDTTVRGGMKFDYRIFKDNDATVLARGFSKHACMDRERKVVRPPAFIMELVANDRGN
ncbi:MAG: acyl-CoA thioesterase [Desulfobacterales bacterium]|nr:acyl-CoA thioesterase [Desulfobacterales bacterium]